VHLHNALASILDDSTLGSGDATGVHSTNHPRPTGSREGAP
jgi:hypothetical protein